MVNRFYFLLIAALCSACSAPSIRSSPAREPIARAEFQEIYREPAQAEPGPSIKIIDPAADSGLAESTAPIPRDTSATITGKIQIDKPNALSPGFAIRISHEEDRELNGKYLIGFDGSLDLPYSVKIQAAGLTLEELRQKIFDAYKPFYKSSSRLTVELAEKAYFVELRGLISKPGKYRVKNDTSIDEVISIGGGFPTGQENQPRYIRVTKDDQTQAINLDDYYKSGSMRADTKWKGGEVIFFQSEPATSSVGGFDTGNQVQVLGELRRPGEFAYRNGADVFFYLTEAGGPTQNTDFDHVQIYRGPPGQRQVLSFELDDPAKFPAVQPGDIMMFRADRQTKFQKNVGTASSLATILSAIALIIIAL